MYGLSVKSRPSPVRSLLRFWEMSMPRLFRAALRLSSFAIWPPNVRFDSSLAIGELLRKAFSSSFGSARLYRPSVLDFWFLQQGLDEGEFRLPFLVPLCLEPCLATYYWSAVHYQASRNYILLPHSDALKTIKARVLLALTPYLKPN